MKKTSAYPLMLCLLLILLASVADKAFSLEIEKPDSTSEDYIIQKNDTLWDISDSKLEDTMLWPKLWNVNPHIENPDLIYPGTKIRIPSKEELMRMSLPPARKPEFTAKPEVEEELFILPEEKIQKYLVDRELYISSGWISATFPSVGETIYSPMGRSITGKGDTVYVKFYGQQSGDKFFTVRNVKEVRHPVTGKSMGYHLRISGTIEITGMDNNMTRARITESFEDIQTGDGLLPYTELEPPLYTEDTRTPDINGYFVESHTSAKVTGKGNVIFLDRGKKDGIEVGDIFMAFSDLPTEMTIGSIKVIAAQDSTASALITSSDHEIMIGSKWGNK